MKCLIVGNDKLGAATKILKKYGVKKYKHLTGREKHLPDKLPSKTDIVIVYTQKVNHEVSKRVKALAQQANKHIIFVRGTAELNLKLKEYVA